MAGAFMDVIVDGLMVMQAKRDPVFGTQDLVAYQMLVTGLASISGGLFGAYFTDQGNPFYCFKIISFMGLLCSLSGILITNKLEIEGDFTAEQSLPEERNETLLDKLYYN